MLINNLSHLIQDNLSIGIIVLNDQLMIQYISPSTEIIFSISSQRSQTLFISEVITEKTDSITLQHALEKKLPCTKHDTVLISPHGKEIIVDYTITPIKEPHTTTYLLIEIIPLNELRLPKDEVLLSQQTANKRLMQGLAHEIKNPLGGIRGAAQLLEKVLPTPDFQEYTHIIITEVDRLAHLVNKMLGTNTLPHYQPTNIHEILEHVYQLATAETQGKIAFYKDYDPSLPELMIDKEQMIQALLNIIRNAIEALSSNQTPHPKISLKTRILRHFIIGANRYRLALNLDIIDNGPGIDPTLKDTLFYPMISGRADGTGLGLAITQTIITQHHGLIECHSVPGHTVFSILLPIE